jgi:hypothetical protein
VASAIRIHPVKDLAVLDRRGISTHTSRMTPETSASISFMIFIASMMQTVWPEVTRDPSCT